MFAGDCEIVFRFESPHEIRMTRLPTGDCGPRNHDRQGVSRRKSREPLSLIKLAPTNRASIFEVWALNSCKLLEGGPDDGRNEECEVQCWSGVLCRPPRSVGRQHPGSSGSGRRNLSAGGRLRQGDNAAAVQLLRLRKKLRLRSGKCGLAG